jgi:hypothetical protein
MSSQQPPSPDFSQQPPPPNYTQQPPPYGQPLYPGYGQQPPQPPKKKPIWLWISGGVGALLVVCCIAVAAMANHSSTTTTAGNTTSSNNSSSSQSQQATATPKSAKAAKVGDTITIDNVSCTLMSVKPLQGDEFTQPKSGNEFVVVHVKIVNKSGSEADYNPFDFHIKTGTGNITDEEFAAPSTYTSNNELQSGKLADGGKVEGDIIFQAPIGDHAAALTWQPSFFGNEGDNAWNLGL